MISIIKYQVTAESSSVLKTVQTESCEIKHLAAPSKACAFNLGLELVSGDYILFLDLCDELVMDQIPYLEEKLFKADPDLCFCSCLIQSNKKEGYKNHLNTYYASSMEILRMIVTLSIPLYSCNVIIRSKMLKQHNIKWNDSLSYYVDDWFVLDVLSKSNGSISSFDYVVSVKKLAPNDYNSGIDGKSQKKFNMEEFPVFYSLLKKHFGEHLKKELEDIALQFKFHCVDAGLLKMDRFNSYLPTPISVIWRQTWSLKRKIYFVMTRYRR